MITDKKISTVIDYVLRSKTPQWDYYRKKTFQTVWEAQYYIDNWVPDTLKKLLYVELRISEKILYFVDFKNKKPRKYVSEESEGIKQIRRNIKNYDKRRKRTERKKK